MRKRRCSAAKMYQVVDQYQQGQQTMAAFCSMQLPNGAVRPLTSGIPLLRAVSDEADQFGDTYAGGAQGNLQGVVKRVGCPADHALEGACGEDSCGDGSAALCRLRRADITASRAWSATRVGAESPHRGIWPSESKRRNTLHADRYGLAPGRRHQIWLRHDERTDRFTAPEDPWTSGLVVPEPGRAPRSPSASRGAAKSRGRIGEGPVGMKGRCDISTTIKPTFDAWALM